MTHSDRPGKPKVTIEALIQLKRCERPAPEFWDRFDQELRAKQLAAIVEKRPWWFAFRLPSAGKQVSRWAGLFTVSAALCAVGLIAIREYQPALPSLSSENLVSSAPVSESLADTRSAYSREVTSDAVSSGTLIGDAGAAENRVGDGRLPAIAIVADAGLQEAHQAENVTDSAHRNVAAARGLTEMIPWAVSTVTSSDTAHEATVVLGELPQVHFLSAISPVVEHRFEGRVEVEPVVMPVRAASMEKASGGAQTPVMLSPREVRRNRILSSLVVADNAADSERSRMGQVREVFASALDDDRLYDGVRRLGMGGDRLTLKF